MREYLKSLVAKKSQVMVNFPAGAGNKLVSQAGIVTEVGENYFLLTDIYGNVACIPFGSFCSVEIRK